MAWNGHAARSRDSHEAVAQGRHEAETRIKHVAVIIDGEVDVRAAAKARTEFVA